MAEQQVDYSQVYDFLYRIERRIGYLEKDAVFIERQIASLDMKKLELFGSLGVELIDIQSDTTSIKNDLGKCMHAMSMLSKDLKSAVKTDDLQMLNSRLDAIQFENYVTRRELNKGLIGDKDV
jgi:hypothetical protein